MTLPAGRARVVVVGGGITGLSCAHRLVRGEDVPEVLVLEAGERPGGAVRTERDGGCLLEAGPDKLVTYKPAGVTLCEQVGLADQLVRPPALATEVLHRGRRVILPDGLAMMAPIRWGAVLRSRLLSPFGKLRLLCEPLVRAGTADDETVGAFAARRFGREFCERVAEPVLGGLFTADVDRLSLGSVMPRLRDIERAHGSVLRGMRRARSAHRAAGHRAGGFVSLSGGLGMLVRRLVERLPAGVLRVGTPVTSLRRGDRSERWILGLAGGECLEADAVVLTCPAFVSAELLASIDPDLGRDLAAQQYASCATVSLLYRRDDVRGSLDSSGFFVPRTEGSPLLACSFVSVKFPERAPEGTVLLRAFVGGAARPDVLYHDDAALADLVHGELSRLLSIAARPRFARMYRFPRSMPQYRIGDPARIERIGAAASRQAGLFVAGGAVGALGLPDCIRSGQTAAEEAREHAAQRVAEQEDRRVGARG